jgi:hypothetical protein
MDHSASRLHRLRPGVEPETLKDALRQALDEARMVLPGVQALFGFQLIAVFSQRFETALNEPEQWLHLAALMLVAVAIALVMTPAAYHRHNAKLEVTERQLRLTLRCVGLAMAPLALGLAIDIYLMARVITHRPAAGLAAAGLIVVLTSALWFVLPRLRKHRD